MSGRDTGGDRRRQRRVGENIRAALAELIVKQIGDPKLSKMTITEVDVSPDLKNARVYFVPLGEGEGVGADLDLERAASYFQRALGQTLKLRFVPRLAFFYDESFDKGARIDRLVTENTVEETDKKNSATPEQALGELVSNSERILLCVHANPDGDAVGSLLGLDGILRLMGKEPIAYCPDGIPATLQFLPGSDRVVAELDAEPFELMIVMDTGDERLLPPDLPEKGNRGVVVVIDHHMAHGELGDIVIRRDVSAVGELIHQLTKELVWPIDVDVAQCLYTSIVADTGSFRYTSTSPDTHRTAADLLAAGADPWASATALFESFSLNRQMLLGAVASTLQVGENGRYADLFCTLEMLDQCDATKVDLDGMINMGRAIRGVEIAAMFREENNGNIKVSFRSKGCVDVAQLAVGFGGGGHRNAAGATVEGKTLEQVRDEVRANATQLFCDLENLDGETATR